MRASVSCHRCMEPLWFSRTWHVTLPCQVGCSSQECKGKPGPQGLVGLVSLCRSCRSTASSILRDFFWNALPIFCSLSFGFVQRDPATPEIYWFLMILDDFPHLPFRGDMWFSNTPICTAWDQNLGPMLVTGQHHVAPRHRHGLIWWEGMANPEPQQGPWQHNLLSQSPDGFDQSRVFWSLEALDATAPHKKKIHWEAPSLMWGRSTGFNTNRPTGAETFAWLQVLLGRSPYRVPLPCKPKFHASTAFICRVFKELHDSWHITPSGYSTWSVTLEVTSSATPEFLIFDGWVLLSILTNRANTTCETLPATINYMVKQHLNFHSIWPSCQIPI